MYTVDDNCLMNHDDVDLKMYYVQLTVVAVEIEFDSVVVVAAAAVVVVVVVID